MLEWGAGLLLRSNVRWRWESSRPLGHLVLRSQLLLLRRSMLMRSLLLLLLLLLGRNETTLATAHNVAEHTITGSNRGWLLRRTSMLRRTSHGWRLTCTAFAPRSLLKLMTQHAQFFFVPGARTY